MARNRAGSWLQVALRATASVLGFAVVTLHAMAPRPAPGPPCIIEAFNAGWRFQHGDVPHAAQVDAAEGGWSPVDLPHDWLLPGAFAHSNSSAGPPAHEIGWYRKTFALPASSARRRVFIEFDGPQPNTALWINGHLLDPVDPGGPSFRGDLTPYLSFGDDARNVLAVRTAAGPAVRSHAYAGAGILRSVRLVLTNEVHLAPDATFVSSPEISPTAARVRLQTAVTNQTTGARSLRLRLALLDPRGSVVANHEMRPWIIPARATHAFQHDFIIAQPQLWELTTPMLYRAQVSIIDGRDEILDEQTTPFGLRAVRFDPATGFWLNDRQLELRGATLPADGGAFGSTVPVAVWEQRLHALRNLGVNAVRTAHALPDPAFLDVCDRLGFLVFEEVLSKHFVDAAATAGISGDQASLNHARVAVRRDRNHPSVILYGVGISERTPAAGERPPKLPPGLATSLGEIDPTRLVAPTPLPADADPFRDLGVDPLVVSWAPSPGTDGLLDRAGSPHPAAFAHRSQWTAEPMVFVARRTAANESNLPEPTGNAAAIARSPVLLPDWNPRHATSHNENVEVFSNAEDVELFLNDKSLGAQKRSPDTSARIWRVNYASGTLRAVARNGGQVVAMHELQTAEAPARLRIIPDRRIVSPDWHDVVRLSVDITDLKGTTAPHARHRVSFSVEGPGVVVAVDNADPASREPFQATTRRAHRGRVYAWVRATAATGRISVTATAEGLKSADVSLEATATRP